VAVGYRETPTRWRLYVGCDESLDKPGELVFFCPKCAEREFGRVS
jgi:hypothetical protein